ncbi:MAG: AsmA family protein [Prevotellaceae bacterium]|jgi:hypothetical protein|nr:AsmA family protein [Prevotellaceae bacterium]
MKKILKITGISLGCLVLLLILALFLAPVLFKDKLTGMAKNMINSNLNAVVDFRDVDISLFRNFPKITVSLNDLSVVSRGDTLASVASFDAGVNLMSYIRKGVIDLNLIEINRPRIHAKVFADNSANWDIAKPSEKTSETETADSADFKVSIERFSIKDGSVMYEDLAGNMLAVIKTVNFDLSGDMSSHLTSLNINASIDGINVANNGTIYAFDLFSLSGKLGADLDKMLFVLNGTEINLNRIALLADGSVQIGNNNDISVNITYKAKVASLKTLVEIIPATILPDVKNLGVKGSMTFQGWVKGLYSDKSMPEIWAELDVENGYLKYPQLPESVNNINISAKALLDMNRDANTNIDVKRFHFEVGGNPFDFSTNITTPMTDPNIKAQAKGKLDFASIKSALPLEGIDLKGVLTANVDFAGKMSHIEKGEYERLNLAGNVSLTGFTAVTEDLPLPLDISDAGLEFTPRYVNLSKLNAKIGESDINASGKLENFLNYAFKNETLKGNLQLSSNYLNCNQLMSSTGSSSGSKVDTSTLSVIVLPSNVDFSINAAIDKILYDNLTLKNAKADVSVKDHALNINSLSAGFAGGQIQLAGKYKAENTSSALANMDMKLSDIHVKEAVSSFAMFEKALPLLKELDGKMSLDFNFSDSFDQNMSPVMLMLNAVGNIRSDSLKILNSNTLNKITSLVGLKEKSNILKNLNANFAISNGKIGITPFPVTVGGISLMIGGDYGLDESLNMQVDMKVPAAQITGAVNDLVSKISGSKSNVITSNTVNIGVAVGGTVKSPSFGLAKAKYFGESSTVQQQATEQAKQVLEEKKQELQTKVEDKLKDEVQKQKDDAVNKLKDIFKKR